MFGVRDWVRRRIDRRAWIAGRIGVRLGRVLRERDMMRSKASPRDAKIVRASGMSGIVWSHSTSEPWRK